MLKIEKFVTMSPEQWEIVIEGMRNPKNSWDRSDSYFGFADTVEGEDTFPIEFFVGENDQTLMESLAKGGPVHAKYRRMMPVWVTLTAPLYWWKEFDTYKVGTVTNSCSTMHKIHAKEFTMEDFSREHLMPIGPIDIRADEVFPFGDSGMSSKGALNAIIAALNHYRKLFLETKDKRYWWQMIQLLPTSYNQKRTVMLNYEVLHNIYESRKNHKLDEWHVFCDWIEELPYSELITMKLEEKLPKEMPPLYEDDRTSSGLLEG